MIETKNKTIEIMDINSNPVDSMSLSRIVFNNTASEAVVHSAVVSYLANQRQGTHATKTRDIVRGGGRKPWKQKKTGRSRHGSIRSPLWRGGGIVFGPQPRDYSIDLPKNMRKSALYKALTMKLSDGEINVVDDITINMPKTKEILKIMNSLGLSEKKVLIVLSDKNENIMLSARNIPAVDVIRVSDINAYHVAVFDHLLFTKDAILKLQSGAEAQG